MPPVTDNSWQRDGVTTVAVLRRVLDPALLPPPAETLRAWWDATAAERARGETTIDRALLGGACADRLGFAFASGYAEALRALVPGAAGEITALCATEEGGNHPRAIRTALVAAGPGQYTLTGKKKWATVASEASALLVVATTGAGDDGKNRLRVVRVPTSAPGVTLRSSSAPFVPEIPHAEVELENVAVAEADVLPGDGYDDYLKPFRTIEDLHVHGALLGYLIGVARRRSMPRDLVETLATLAISTRALAAADAKAEATHVALAGLITLVTRAVTQVEEHWSPDDERTRWDRDRPLLRVASAAREARRERAWSLVTLGDVVR
jgi:acyl-CoA dehydrogenase